MICKETVALDLGGVRAVFVCRQPKNHTGPHICQLLDGQTPIGQIEWGESQQPEWEPDVWLGALEETTDE